MRFFKVFTFILLLFFSLNVVAQTATHTPRKVALQLSCSSSPSAGTRVMTPRRSAGMVTVGTGAVIGAIFGGPIGAALGAAIGRSVANWFSSGSSFDKILHSFSSLGCGSWFSSIFNMIFNASNQLTTSVNDRLGPTVINILMIMMAFYILFTVTKHILTFSAIEPAKFFGEIFFPLGRMILAVWFIRNWTWMFDNVITPLLELAIKFGTEMMESISNSSTSYTPGGESIGVAYATCTENGTGNGGLKIGVCNGIQTFLKTLSTPLIVWMAFGATLFTDCWGEGFLKIFPSFKMLFIGIIIFVFTFMIYVSFPLKLVDAMFRLIFVTALFPLWAMFWVIPQTRNYTKEAFKMLVNVMATFLSASAILVMIVAILANLFEGIPLTQIIRLLQDGKTEQAMDRIGFSTSGLFFSVCLLFMASHLVSKVDYFAAIFGKQDSLGIGEAVGGKAAATIRNAPQAYTVGKNVAKWGAGRVKAGWGVAKEGWNRHRAKDYNKNAPGNKTKDGAPVRQSPRLWTAPIPGTGLWDAHKAKDQIGTYSRTKGVQVSGVEKNKDGSTQQTYSNRTVDKHGNTLAQMHETTSTSADKSKQSVDRKTTHFDDFGATRRVSNVKKDFENGQAVRKTTTTNNKDGTRTEMTVDKKKGLATKTRFGANNQILSKETRDSLGNRTTSKYENGRLTEENTIHRDKTSTQTLHGIDGSTQKLTRDAEGTVRGASTKRADGSTQTIRYSKERSEDGTPNSFERVEKDASRQKTEHLRVDLKNDSFQDMLTGVTGKWSERGKKT